MRVICVRCRVWCCGLLLGVLLPGSDARSVTPLIRLRNETIATPEPVRSAALRPQGVEPSVSGLFLIQFAGRLQPAWRDQLRSLGVRLERFVPDDAFVARVEHLRLSQLRALPFVRWVGEYRPDHKLHSSLRAFSVGAGSAEAPAIRLMLAPGASPLEILQVRRTLQRAQGETRSRFGRVLSGRVNQAQLTALAQSAAVLWIEPAPRHQLLDEIASKIVAGGTLQGDPVNHATAMQQLGFDGQGVVVAVADSGLDNGDAATMHPDLFGRVDAFQFYGTLPNAADEHGHGTHVAGIVAGDGATGETDDATAGTGTDEEGNPITLDRNPALYGLGVAPRAHLVVQRVFDAAGGDELPAYETLTHDAVRAGAVIGSNSWGDEVAGRYDLSAATFDALVRDADADAPGDQPYILEFSAGNAGPGPQTIDSPAVAKNVIATGASQNDRPDFFIYADGPEAMADFSSRGPCEDGRIKPDVVAPGTWIASLESASAGDANAWAPISPNYLYMGGTSQAGPHVSGAAAVFVQYYRATHTNATPSPALVKAALINSAVDLDDLAGTDPVPNMDEGWGRVDLTRLIGAARRYEFTDQTQLLATGQTHEHSVIVASSAEPLKITLAYTDVPGFPAAIPALVNDLDLEVIAPDGQVYRGNQFIAGESAPGLLAPDNLNNVEAVHLATPLVGEYRVRVIARNVVEDARQDTAAVDQDFALVVSGDIPFPGVGVVALDRAAYTAPGQMQIKLIDLDLAGQASATVRVSSTTEATRELITLHPLGANGVFTGSVAIVTGPAVADGRLQVANGDAISVEYQDAGGVRTATAVADLVPPVITDVAAANHFGRTVITWTTDEAASGIVRYGTNAALAAAVTNGVFDTTQALALGETQTNVTYFYEVIATDVAGNVTTNNNGGKLFTFVPQPARTVLLVDAYTPNDSQLGGTDIPVTTYTDALDQTGVSYEVWDANVNGSPGTNDLRPFRVVIWRLNDNPLASDTLSTAQQNALQSYVNGGGALFLSSMELLTHLGNVPFRENVLHVKAFVEDAGVPSVLGEDYDPVADTMALNLDYTPYDSDILQVIGQSPDVSDIITVSTNATPIFFDASSGSVAGLRFPRTGQDSAGRVVFLSFPFDTISATDPAPDNRATLLRNILNFLAPGLNGVGTVAFDSPAYTIPSRVLVEVADSDLAGKGQASVKISSDVEPAGRTLTLTETAQRGLFRGSFTLVGQSAATVPGQLRAKNGDTLVAQYFDASATNFVRAAAEVDTVVPVLTNIFVTPEYVEATVTWDTIEFADSLVQFGESRFLGRTAYDADLTDAHELVLTGLVPDRVYYFQVVSRDAAGNVATDDKGGKFYSFRTLRPLAVPWTDDLEHNAGAAWSVQAGAESNTQWQLGVPANGRETAAHSPTNAWGSNLDGAALDTADTLLVSPALNLTGGNLATLQFWHSYDFSLASDSDIYHFGQVYVSTNNSASWVQLDEFADLSDGWEPAEYDLSPYLGSVVRLGFYYGLFSVESVPRAGWLVDDISVTVTNIIPGTIVVTNNLSQGGFALTGPINRGGAGLRFIETNAPAGDYAVTFNDVPLYGTPAPQTNTLTAGGLLLFAGQYTLADTNHNGIADAWEQQYFGIVSPMRDQSTDTDHDGFTDYAEFLAGTNPTNATSALRVAPPTLLHGDALRLTWPSVPGHAYRIEGSTNATSWTPLTGWLRAGGSNLTHTLTGLTNGAPYLFRLQVVP